VLRSFRDKDTEAVWHRQRSRRLDGPTQRTAWRKLAMLDAAESLGDLLVPPGNLLEKLSGDRGGQHSIRINRQWRICFRWTDAGPEDVEIVDYHQERAVTAETIMEPVHPGEVLMEEFLKPLELSQYQLAKELSVPARRINEIVHGDRRITADTALRLARFFGTSERFWMNLQARYDLEIERDRLGATLDSIRPMQAVS
jgi:addiction module HigA family antidote